MFSRIDAGVAVDIVEFCTRDRPCKKVIAKIDIASICAGGNGDGRRVRRGLPKVGLLDFPNLICARRQIDKNVVADSVGEGGRFVKVHPAVIVDVEIDLPVGNWDISRIGAAVGVEVVVFVAADATDLEVANVDVADVDLAGGFDVVD